MLSTLTHFKNRPRALVGALLTLACLSAASGCTALQGVQNIFVYNDATNDFVLGWRNSVWARQAWAERKSQFRDQPQFYDFGAGFRAGYEDVANGGNGCPPGIAPREYWNWKYQSPEGQAKVAAWFAGYPHGARAAEEDGAGLYQGIQISGSLERQCSPEFIQGAIMPHEEIPPGHQTPEPLPPSPTATDTSSNARISDMMSRSLAANRSSSTVGYSSSISDIQPATRTQQNWPVVQASSMYPTTVIPVAAQASVQQASAISR